jgi:hypothetical protein
MTKMSKTCVRLEGAPGKSNEAADVLAKCAEHTRVVQQLALGGMVVFRDIPEMLEEKPQRVAVRDRQQAMSVHGSPLRSHRRLASPATGIDDRNGRTVAGVTVS